jgi:tetraacyldisaccharide 4''-kinase
MIVSKVLLFPYYVTLKARNRLYDKGRLASYGFNIPIVSVGNITVGGTGKTPMCDLIASLLKEEAKVAVLSKGYKRSTKGFMMVEPDDSAQKVGDEPLQTKRRHPGIIVAVDEDRRHGIETLAALPEEQRPDVIILDDGFQRRDIRPTKSILLQSYSRPIFKDELLPLGRLRDLPEQTRRADAVVVTKCPAYLDEWEREKFRKVTRLRNDQEMFFTEIQYCEPAAVFPQFADKHYIYAQDAFLFTGIADEKPLKNYLQSIYRKVIDERFPDHHDYSKSDVRYLKKVADQYPRSVLLTTEKDAQRLLHNPYISDAIKVRLFYIPIQTRFLTIEEECRFANLLRKDILAIPESIAAPIPQLVRLDVEPEKAAVPEVVAEPEIELNLEQAIEEVSMLMPEPAPEPMPEPVPVPLAAAEPQPLQEMTLESLFSFDQQAENEPVARPKTTTRRKKKVTIEEPELLLLFN